MSTLALPGNDVRQAKIGDYHSWWLEDTPKDAEAWFPTYQRFGQNFSASHKRDRDGKYRDGSAWLLNKLSVKYGGEPVKIYRGEQLAYEGCFVSSIYGPSTGNTTRGTPQFPDSTSEDALSRANSYGAQAYAALKPDTPDFSAAVSLAELRELPGQLQDAFKGFMRLYNRLPGKWSDAGKMHLATEFGWVPLISDIGNFSEAFIGRTKRFEQMLRDEGRPVRRRRNLSKTGSDSKDASLQWSWADWGTGNGDLSPVLVYQCYGDGRGGEEVAYQNTKVWCAGKSRYYLPPGPRNDVWTRKLHRRILGLQADPATLYNLIPWSWLVDYFTGLGHFMDAISPGVADCVVFDYAFVMHHQTSGHRFNSWQNMNTTKGHGTTKVTGWCEEVHERKARQPASPFGWGIDEGDLTPRQASILVALGLSRL